MVAETIKIKATIKVVLAIIEEMEVEADTNPVTAEDSNINSMEVGM